MRFHQRILAFACAVLAAACDASEHVQVSERLAIADSLQALVSAAYDFSKPNASDRLLSLYPDKGRVISAFSGRITNNRQALSQEIMGFWQRVGQNMRAPKFVLGSVYVDVVTRNAAVMTFTYSIPHTTPAGMPHVVSGAWTSFWRRQGGRWMIVQEHLSDTPESTTPLAPASSESSPLAGTAPGHQTIVPTQNAKKN